MGIIYVNSTLGVRRAMSADGKCSPVHCWGYQPGAEDRVHGHRINRWEIHLRARLGGLDPTVCAAVTRDLLLGGRRQLYLVTQPDGWALLPLWRRLFPDLRAVTWVWTPSEARTQLRRLRACTHVLCLTEGARAELVALGFPPERCSVEFWGADPAFYARPSAPAPGHDVLFFGLIGRDVTTVRAASRAADFTVAAPAATLEALKTGVCPEIKHLPTPATAKALVDLIHTARVAWIPLLANNGEDPTGYTNLIESLLCGTAVVLSDNSTIPSTVLTLPGVYLYRTGDAEDLRSVTRRALDDISAEGDANFRRRVRDAAAPVLDARRLGQTIRRALGLIPGPGPTA